MSTCKQYIEAVDAQIERLLALKGLGYDTDIENNNEDIATMIKGLKLAKADRLDAAARVVEVDKVQHSVLGINNAVIRYGNRKIDRVLKWETIDGRDEYTVDFGTYVKKVESITLDDMNVKDYQNKYPELFGTTEHMREKLRNIDKEYDLLDENMWKDQKKVVELFDQIVENDGQKTEHTEYLRDLLKKISDPQANVMNEFKIYMNTKAKANGGIAQPYGGGADAKIVLDIKEGSTLDKNEMTGAEAFVHEMIHMSIETAKTYNKGPLAGVMVEMVSLYDQASTILTPENIGADLHAYMFDNKEGLSEFIAYAMTNEKVRNLLSQAEASPIKERKLRNKTLFDKLMNAVLKVYDGIMQMAKDQSKTKTIDDRVGYLVTRLWEHNNITSKDTRWHKRVGAIVNEARTYVDKKLVNSAKYIGHNLEAGLMYMEEEYKDTAVGSLAKGTLAIGYAVHPWKDERQKAIWENTRKALNVVAEEMGIGSWFAPEGQITRLLEHITNRDDPQKQKVERFGLYNKQIDSNREGTIELIAGQIKNGLDGVDRKDYTALTRGVLEIDLAAIANTYELEGIGKMLDSNKEIDKNIETEYKKLDKLVEDKELSNFYKSQTKGLGSYLATGVGGAAVYKNVYEMFVMKGSGLEMLDAETYEKKREILPILDRLATIEGIRNTAAKDRQTVSKIIKSHPQGVTDIMALYSTAMNENRALAAQNKTYVFPNKGEIKELLPTYMSTRVDKGDEETIKKMKKLGYRKKSETAVEGVFLYTRVVSDLGAFNKQALAKISMGKRLHSVDAMHGMLNGTTEAADAGAEAIDTVYDSALREMRRMTNSVVMPKMDGYEMQTVGSDIVNFNISIPKDVQERDMSQQKAVHSVVSKMIAETEEKKAAQELNKMVWDEMVRDMSRNYRRGEMAGKREYIEIGPDAKFNEGANVAERYSQSIWDDMPKDIRAKIKDKSPGQRYIAVRRDLADMYFGRRAPSLLRARLPWTETSTEDLMRKNGMGMMADMLLLAGDIWSEIVSLQKVDIVIRTPGVILGNIQSNANLAIAMGQAPHEAVLQTMSMVKATKQYTSTKKRIDKIKYNIKMKRGDRAEQLREIRKLEAELTENPVHDLMEAGLYTTIIEDVSDKDLTNATLLEEAVEKYVPKIIRDIVSALWITSDNPIFKMLMTTVQYSDFVARANRYHVLLAQGVNKNVAMKTILDEHVNYGMELGSALSWTEKMGFSRFLKYTVGSNKMILEKAAVNPTALLGMALTGVESPVNAFAFMKNWDYALMGPIDSIVGMTEKHVVPPSMFEFAYNAVK